MIRQSRNVARFSISSCHHHIFHVFKPTMRKKLLICKHQSNCLGFKTPQYIPRTFIHRYHTSYLMSKYIPRTFIHRYHTSYLMSKYIPRTFIHRYHTSYLMSKYIPRTFRHRYHTSYLMSIYLIKW